VFAAAAVGQRQDVGAPVQSHRARLVRDTRRERSACRSQEADDDENRREARSKSRHDTVALSRRHANRRLDDLLTDLTALSGPVARNAETPQPHRRKPGITASVAMTSAAEQMKGEHQQHETDDPNDDVSTGRPSRLAN